MPFSLAFNVFLIVHLLLSGIFTFYLARSWGLRESASLLAAILFMFSGYMISVMNLATTLSSIVWLPVILLFFDKALSGKGARYALISSICLGIMFLGGEPSIFYSTLWFLLFYSVFYLLNSRGASSKRTVGYYILTVVLGILLSSVQLLPLLELIRHADRTITEPAYKLVTSWSLPIKDTFSFIVPFLTRTDFSKESYWKEQNWAILIYLGVFAILLIVMASLFNKDWRTKFLIFVGLLFLLISYGSNTPFYYLVYKFIPGFRYVRYPVRFLYITTFSVSILCGIGFNSYIEGREKDDERLSQFFNYLLVVLCLFSILFLALHLYKDDLIRIVYDRYAKWLDPKKDGAVLYAFLAAILNLKRFFGFLVAGGMVLYLGLKSKLRQGVVSFAFISLVIVDIFSAIPPCHITVEKTAFHSTTPNIEFLKRDKSVFRFFISPKTRESDSFLKGRTFEEAMQAVKDSLAPNLPLIFGLYDAGGYDSIRLARYAKLMLLVETSKLPSDTRILDLVNAKYLVILDKIDAKGYRLVNKGSAYLYENTNVLPRAFLVSSYKVLKNEMDIANRFKSKDFDPAKEVILEKEPIINTRYPIPDTQYPKEDVEITKYSPNEVIIKAVVNSPKFLVLSDTYYPGWKVYVDGKIDYIYKANFILRAVYLTTGAHAVRFVFDPFSFKLGAIISLTTLALVVFYIVYKKI